MRDKPHSNDLRVLWKEQPKEDTPVNLDHMMNRRTWQLHVSTRSEIVMSIAAAVFFAGVLAWRLPPAGFMLQPAGLAAAAIWIAIVAFRFRKIIWGSGAPPDTAATISATPGSGTDRCWLPRCFSSRASPAAGSPAWTASATPRRYSGFSCCGS